LQPAEATTAIERIANRVRAPLHIAGEHWTAGEEHGRLVYQDDDGLLDLPAPRLAGRHQFDNAGLAVAALRTLRDWKLPTHAFERGIASAEWAARLQRLPPGPLTNLLPDGCEVWLDGGHNAGAGRSLSGAMADLEDRVSRPLVLIVGMLTTKDVEAFLQNFAGLARRVIAVPISEQEKSASPEAIADAARRVGLAAEARSSVADALIRVAQLKIEPPPRVLITGSLYLAGEVLAENGPLPE
jgi:dihydrofolate synthase/folylpolyglutamate synthase